MKFYYLIKRHRRIPNHSDITIMRQFEHELHEFALIFKINLVCQINFKNEFVAIRVFVFRFFTYVQMARLSPILFN